MNRQHKTLNIRKLALLKNNPEQYYQKYPDEKPNIFASSIKSYSHKPYLAKMPYDRNSRHPLKMCARYMALEEYEKELKDTVKGFNQEFADAQDNYNRTKEYVDELQKDYDKLREDLKETHKAYDEAKSSFDYTISGEKMREGYDEISDILFGDGDETPSLLEELGMGNDSTFMADMEMNLDDAMNFLHGPNATGYCDEEHAKKIDAYIQDIKDLDVASVEEKELQEYVIEKLEYVKDNSGYEEPFLVGKDDHGPFPTFEDLNKSSMDELSQLGEDLRIAKEEVDISKKQMSGAKKKAHERNVALYEVANEKQNCEDIFDDAGILGDADNQMPSIDEYIKMTDLKSHVDKDGTVKDDYLANWDREMEDMWLGE